MKPAATGVKQCKKAAVQERNFVAAVVFDFCKNYHSGNCSNHDFGNLVNQLR